MMREIFEAMGLSALLAIGFAVLFLFAAAAFLGVEIQWNDRYPGPPLDPISLRLALGGIGVIGGGASLYTAVSWFRRVEISPIRRFEIAGNRILVIAATWFISLAILSRGVLGIEESVLGRISSISPRAIVVLLLGLILFVLKSDFGDSDDAPDDNHLD